MKNKRIEQQNQDMLFLSKLKELPDNYCIDGQDIPLEQPKDYLKAFAAGNCSPLMFLPGLLNTKIVVEINCEVLRDENKEVFDKCGWTDCDKSTLEVKILKSTFFIILRFGKVFQNKSIQCGFRLTELQ